MFTARDPFEGWPDRPETLHPYHYAGNRPVVLRDPSGRCYPPLEWLRTVEELNCYNLDQAIQIVSHPQASWWDKTQAGGYITAFAIGHAAAFVSAGILASQAVVAGPGLITAMSQWGASYLVAYPTVATVATGTAVVAGVVDDAAMVTTLATGTADEKAAAYESYQLGAIDGAFPFGDVAAAGAIIGGRFNRRPFCAPDGGGGSGGGFPGDKLPVWRDGQPTRGILVVDGREIPVESGKKGPAASMPPDTPGMRKDMFVRDHAEAQAAATMRQQNIKEATLYINKKPCPGPLGCDAQLPNMLPEDAILHVYSRTGNGPWELKTYTGLPDSAFRGPR